MSERERPSRHGAILGEALAALAMAGGAESADMCATCAFREGCMTNQMAATGIQALHCVLGLDKDQFACHHGMKDGEPVKLCMGYIAAQLAPWPTVQATVERLNARLQGQEGPDEIRAAFDAWIDEIDPDGQMDDYQRGRAYLKAAASSQATSKGGAEPLGDCEANKDHPKGVEGLADG